MSLSFTPLAPRSFAGNYFGGGAAQYFTRNGVLNLFDGRFAQRVFNPLNYRGLGERSVRDEIRLGAGLVKARSSGQFSPDIAFLPGQFPMNGSQSISLCSDGFDYREVKHRLLSRSTTRGGKSDLERSRSNRSHHRDVLIRTTFLVHDHNVSRRNG